MAHITKAVIPAAGLGTRMSPLTDYLPKPMLPLGRKPVLQHIVDELIEAEIREIGIVVHPEHHSVFSYFGDFPRVTFIRDDSTSGPGGALLRAEEFIGGEEFIALFSDAPFRGPGRGRYLRELTRIKESEGAAAVLSMYRIPPLEVSFRGVIMPRKKQASKAVRLTDIIEKPSPSATQEEEQWASACRYVLDPRIFETLKCSGRGEGGELQLTPAIRSLIKQGEKVFGLPLEENLSRYDTGNFDGYFEALTDFASDD